MKRRRQSERGAIAHDRGTENRLSGECNGGFVMSTIRWRACDSVVKHEVEESGGRAIDN